MHYSTEVQPYQSESRCTCTTAQRHTCSKTAPFRHTRSDPDVLRLYHHTMHPITSPSSTKASAPPSFGNPAAPSTANRHGERHSMRQCETGPRSSYLYHLGAAFMTGSFLSLLPSLIAVRTRSECSCSLCVACA